MNVHRNDERARVEVRDRLLAFPPALAGSAIRCWYELSLLPFRRALWRTQMVGYYYERQHLADFAKIADTSPELGKKFFEYYGSVFADGALSAREKSLIALAVAHAVQCPYCIEAYSKDCNEKGDGRWKRGTSSLFYLRQSGSTGSQPG